MTAWDARYSPCAKEFDLSEIRSHLHRSALTTGLRVGITSLGAASRWLMALPGLMVGVPA